MRSEVCVLKSIELACSGKEIYHLLLCFTLYSRANSNYKPPRGLYSEGRFNGGFFLRYDFGELIFGGAYFRNFTVSCKGEIFFLVFSSTFP